MRRNDKGSASKRWMAKKILPDKKRSRRGHQETRLQKIKLRLCMHPRRMVIESVVNELTLDPAFSRQKGCMMCPYCFFRRVLMSIFWFVFLDVLNIISGRIFFLYLSDLSLNHISNQIRIDQLERYYIKTNK